MFEHLEQKRLRHGKSLCDIKLEQGSRFPLAVQELGHLLDEKEVFMDAMTSYENILVHKNNRGQSRRKTIRHELDDQFGKTIDQAYGPETSNLLHIWRLGNQNQESGVHKVKPTSIPLCNT